MATIWNHPAALRAAPAAVLALLLAAAPRASAEPQMPLDALRQAYLACERAAASGRLDAGEVMRCSIVYEELKRRAFDGDSGRLRTWLAAEKAAGS